MASDDVTEQSHYGFDLIGDYARLQAFYSGIVDAAVREDGYDVEVHRDTAATLLSQIFRFGRYSSNADCDLPEDYLDTAFGSPEALAEALVNTSLFRLINEGWPNVNTLNRAVSVSQEEYAQNSDVELPEDDDGKRIDTRIYDGQDWHIPPIVGLAPDTFLPKAFDLIEQETSIDDLSVWPLTLLCLSNAFTTCWISWGEMLHEQNAKYPLWSADLLLDLLKRCAEKDSTGSNQIAGHLNDCHWSIAAFRKGDRSEGFTYLERALSVVPISEWALGYLDYEIQQSSLKRGDLDIHEWLQMFKLAVVSFENTFRSEDKHEVLSAGSTRGLGCPINEEDYWAWRMGWVIASGIHLKDEIMDLAFRKELNQYQDELVDLVRSVPISIPLDLMQSFGPVSDLRAIERGIGEIYRSIAHEGFRTREVGVIEPDDYLFTNHGEDRRHWLIKLGFIWYIRSQSLVRSSGASSDEGIVLESLDKQWTDSDDNRIKDLVRSSQEETNQELQRLTAAFQSFADQQAAAQNNQVTSTTQLTHQQLVELLGDRLCDALSPDARLELRLAEGHFQHREEGDSGHAASQHYANCVEGQLNHSLGPLFVELFAWLGFTSQDTPPKPRFIGQWSRSLRNEVLRYSNTGFDLQKVWPGFDPIQIEILVERLSDLNPGRSKSHPGISRMMANTSRELVLGELVGGTEPGILQIMAKLANRG